jgi:tetratricopeptide (TPR) repeat protein
VPAKDKDKKISFGNSKRFLYVKAVIGLVLALLSKPAGVVFPVIALLLDFLFYKKSLKEIINVNLLFILLTVPIIIISVLTESAAIVKFEAPLLARPIVFLDTISFYILKIVAPFKLAASYGNTPQSLMSNSDWIFGSIGAIVILGFIFSISKKYSKLLLLAFFIVIAGYLPVSGLLSFYYQYMSTTADRYMYIPMLGASLAFTVVITKFKSKNSANFFAAAILIICVVLTLIHLPVWKDEMSLWTNTIDNYPEKSAHPYSGRGLLFMNDKRLKEASSDFDKAIELDSTHWQALYNRGNVYLDIGNYAKAAEDLSRSIKFNPGNIDAYTNRGLAYSELNRLDDAVNDFTKALSIKSGQPDVYSNRGIVFAKKGDYLRAEADFRKALELDPNDNLAKENLNMVLELIGKQAK